MLKIMHDERIVAPYTVKNIEAYLSGAVLRLFHFSYKFKFIFFPPLNRSAIISKSVRVAETRLAPELSVTYSKEEIVFPK